MAWLPRFRSTRWTISSTCRTTAIAKRDNYHRLGVPEVWLVDREERCVEVSRAPGAGEIVRDVVRWRPPGLDLEVRVDLDVVFFGLE